MPYSRKLMEKLQLLADQFPIVSIVGPRQSGKTTLAKLSFPSFRYVSLEDLDNRDFAESDPRGFLQEYSKNVIIDEVQRVPNLLSYLQTHVDKTDEPGQYILTGSAQFQLVDNLSQSLAGRSSILTLLPFSLAELAEADLVKETYEEQLITGFYPRLYKTNMQPTDWYASYTQTYLEKDVRELSGIRHLAIFQKFLKLCAGRNGQIINISDLSADCGISPQTVREWLSILEASFILYLLPSYHENFNKRLIKSSKLYFYDTGLVCYLLGIRTVTDLKMHYLRGAIFESYVMAEIIKHQVNLGEQANVYYWREKNKNEVDCIIESSRGILAVEIKSSRTFQSDFLKGLKYWHNLTGHSAESSFLVYGGEHSHTRSGVNILAWNKVSDLFLAEG